MTRVLINASPLIFKGKIDKLDIVQKLFTVIITTEQVKREVLSNYNQMNYELLKKY